MTRTLTWQEHWTYRATILLSRGLSRRRVQRIITPKILRIVRAVHFKLQQIITSQVLDKLDERRINLQKQNANPNDRKPVRRVMWCYNESDANIPAHYANVYFNHFIGAKASHDTSDVSFSFLAALSVCRSFEGRTLPQHGKEKVFL